MKRALGAIYCLLVLHTWANGQTSGEYEAIRNAMRNAAIRAMEGSDEEAYREARKAGITRLEDQITEYHRRMRAAQESGRAAEIRKLRNEVERLEKDLKSSREKNGPPRFPPIDIMARSLGTAGSLPSQHPNGSRLNLIIDKVVSPTQVVVLPQWPNPDIARARKIGEPVLVSNIDAARLRPGQRFMSDGCFRVGRTKLENGQSIDQFRRIGPFDD